MNYEQWKLQRELEEQSEFNSYSSKVQSATNICFIFFGVTVLIMVVMVLLYGI